MSRCDSYTAGNCTWGACEENGWIPEGLGDGGDWAVHAAARGLVVVSTPVAGSVVSYCRGGGYSAFGHCGSVLEVAQDGRFLVREMNFVALGQYDDRWSSMADVCGFILPPGATGSGQGGPGPEGPAPGTPGVPWQAVNAWEQLRQATQQLALERTGRVIGAYQLVQGI